MNFFRWILIFCVLLVVGYYIWGYTGKDYSSLHTRPVTFSVSNDSVDRGKGNLLGIQPFLTAADYCDQQHFHDALHAYFKKSQTEGLLRPNTIVVLPENIGTWLAFANEKTRVYEADSMRQAVSTIVNSNIFAFIRNLLVTPADDKIKHAFVYMKAASMASIYTAVFSSLAKEFKVTIAAGSIILPEPSVDSKQRIHTKKGSLYYSSFLFAPDGKIQGQPVLKILPEYNSGKLGSEADSNQYKVYQTPAGYVLTSTREDARFYSFRTNGKIITPQVLIFLNGSDRIWNVLWKGSNGFSIPLDVVTAGVNTSHGEWLDYKPAPNRQGNGIQAGICNRFNGRMWEINFFDITIAVHGKLQIVQNEAHAGKITNLWLQ